MCVPFILSFEDDRQVEMLRALWGTASCPTMRDRSISVHFFVIR